MVEALNSVERRAAIETGQEVDRQDIKVTGKLDARQELLAKAFAENPLELEAIRDRTLAAAEPIQHEKVVDALPEENEGNQQPAFPRCRPEGLRHSFRRSQTPRISSRAGLPSKTVSSACENADFCSTQFAD